MPSSQRLVSGCGGPVGGRDLHRPLRRPQQAAQPSTLQLQQAGGRRAAQRPAARLQSLLQQLGGQAASLGLAAALTLGGAASAWAGPEADEAGLVREVWGAPALAAR